jgi:hypothetical protein
MIRERDPQVTLWEVAGVGHGSAISDARGDYERHVMGFVRAETRGRSRVAVDVR